MLPRTLVALAAALAVPTGSVSAQMPAVAPIPPVNDEGDVTTPSFTLPFSSLASPEARKAFVEHLRAPTSSTSDIAAIRRNTDEKVMLMVDKSAALYPYGSVKSKLGGVSVETFVPKAGIAPENRNRVLIQVHGGGFVAGGGGPTGAAESVPIAGTMRIKVVAVDYRMAPEFKFPAASEDLAAVYRELLKQYRPENIGIYGCSAGGMLAAEAIPWFLKEHLPLPGAIGIFCASTHAFSEGDSAQVWSRMGSTLRLLPPLRPDGTFGRTSPYFAGADPHDPLAIPAKSQDVLKAFPPTLFLTGTRAPEMSAAAQSHIELLDLGRTSELALFDGMDHGFYTDATLPESQRAYRLIARFFDAHLGKGLARPRR